MFEAIMKHFAAGQYEVISAGTKATVVHPLAIKVLAEIGISTEGQYSKRIVALNRDEDKLILEDQHGQRHESQLSRIAHVIALCGGANESCPLFPANVLREHWPIDDPDQYSGSEESVLPYFRASRDDILQRVKNFITSINTKVEDSGCCSDKNICDVSCKPDSDPNKSSSSSGCKEGCC
jgi:arsenate reductase